MSNGVFLFLLIILLLHGSFVISDCIWENIDDGQAAVIECQLRILDFRKNSSDIPGVKRVQSLKIQCSDAFFFESQLRSDHFGNLPHLSDLTIKYCKIHQLPPRSFVGLAQLRHVVIHTHNSDWSSLKMQPDYESLIGLDNLETLDLMHNNLKSIPSGFFCPLLNIRALNLAKNMLIDLENIGLSHRNKFKCTIPLKTLIMSSNGLKVISAGSLASATSLQKLDLSKNQLAVLVENAFDGLHKLSHLDLSHNKLVALPPNIFASTPLLIKLQLSNNSLGTMDLNTFHNLTQLQELNISGNNLDENWIKAGILDGLINLVLLDLSSNHISKIETNLFRHLHSLQILNLSYNKLHTISSSTFLFQSDLQILLLSYNQLEAIYHQTLLGLKAVHTLALDHNRIHSVHNAAFRNCSSLNDLSLANNFLTEVPQAVHGVESLRSLDLNSNVIGILELKSLQNLPNLIVLKISRNELNRIGESAFLEAPLLQHLDLSGNRFEAMDQNTFNSLSDLQSLNLANNRLEDLNGILTTQIKLKWLNISNNRLGWFDYAFIPPSLEWLDLQHNEIDNLGNYYSLRDQYSLKYLDASFNKIVGLDVLSTLPSLEDLYLNDNYISKVAPNTFIGKPSLARVNLQRNEISSLMPLSLMVSTSKLGGSLPMFYLSSNPFVCDCKLKWIKIINTLSEDFPQVMDIDRVSCSVVVQGTASTSMKTKFISQVKDEDFLCQYQSHCFDMCLCCDYFACDCRMQCPDGCKCFHDKVWSYNVIQCSSGNHKSLPNRVPMNASTLYLDGNNISVLESGTFIGRSKLEKLYLNNSHIAEIQNSSFSGLDSLKILHLHENELQTLKGGDFDGLSVLLELFLQKNQIVSIEQNVFRHMKLLSVLKLDGNLLISFPVWELSSNPALIHLTLSNNWWECNCEFVRKFRMFIDGNRMKIADANEVTCSSDNVGHFESFVSYEECSRSMFSDNSYSISMNFSKSFIIPTIIGLIIFLFIILALFITVYKAKLSVRIWLYAKYGLKLWPSSYSNYCMDDVLFDALIVYCLKDSCKVHESLVKNLQAKYRLCLHQQDLSGIYTSEAFTSALKASAYQIIFMSEALMNSDWDIIKDIVFPRCIIIMAIDDVSHYHSCNSRFSEFLASARFILYIEEKTFWKKLHFFLPHTKTPQLFNFSGLRNFTLSRHNTSSTKMTKEAESPSMLFADETKCDKLAKYPEDIYHESDRPPAVSLLTRLLHEKEHQENILCGFPYPPMKKQPHQCSTHSLVRNSICNGYPHTHHERSVSSHYVVPTTRSCGTNAISPYHQRSASANATSAPPNTSPTFMDKLIGSSTVNDTTQYFHRRGLPAPPPPFQTINARRKLFPPALDIVNHQRSNSCNTDPHEPGSHFTKHKRSSSTLTPVKIHWHKQLDCRLSGSDSVRKEKRDKQGYKSATNLFKTSPLPSIIPASHERSSSTPYKGFIV